MLNNNLKSSLSCAAGWRVVLGVLAASFFLSGHVHAATMTPYTDKTAFDTAVGVTSLETFDSGNCCSNYTNINSTTVPGINPGVNYSLATPFTGTYSLIFNGGGGFSPGNWLHSYAFGGTSALKIDFVAPVAAIGFVTNSYMGSGFTATFKFGGGEESVQNVSGISGLVPQFFGFAADTMFSTVEIQGTGSSSNFAVDDLQYGGSISAVPLPAALPLLLAALGVFGLIKRRRIAT